LWDIPIPPISALLLKLLKDVHLYNTEKRTVNGIYKIKILDILVTLIYYIKMDRKDGHYG